jgi:hypothetical protein
MKLFDWNNNKNQWFKDERGIVFEDIVYHLNHGGLLDVMDHPTRRGIPGQRIFILWTRHGRFHILEPIRFTTNQEVAVMLHIDSSNDLVDTVPSDDAARPKWFASPVTFHEGALVDMYGLVPEFERRPLAVTQENGMLSRINERLDLIVRKPIGEDAHHVPVGVVSRDYLLVQHQDVLCTALTAFERNGLAPSDIRTEMELTEYGERMALSMYLPDDYAFTPKDDHPMSLRLECFNSVDGSSRFRLFMGWFRLVCSNGLIIGVTSTDLRRRHRGEICLEDMETILRKGIVDSTAEQEHLLQWQATPVNSKAIAPWIDNTILKAWKFKAATRAYHICLGGSDVVIVEPFKDKKPTTIAVRATKKVPGAQVKATNLFDVSQVLAWLARQRRDVQEQLAWREKIPELLKPLMN